MTHTHTWTHVHAGVRCSCQIVPVMTQHITPPYPIPTTKKGRPGQMGFLGPSVSQNTDSKGKACTHTHTHTLVKKTTCDMTSGSRPCRTHTDITECLCVYEEGPKLYCKLLSQDDGWSKGGRKEKKMAKGGFERATLLLLYPSVVNGDEKPCILL